MWTNENRARYDRSGLRYPGDLIKGAYEEQADVAKEREARMTRKPAFQA